MVVVVVVVVVMVMVMVTVMVLVLMVLAVHGCIFMQVLRHDTRIVPEPVWQSEVTVAVDECNQRHDPQLPFVFRRLAVS